MRSRQKPLEMNLATLWSNLGDLTELHPDKIVLSDAGDIDLKRTRFWDGLEIIAPNATGVINGVDTNFEKLTANKATKINLWGNRSVKEVRAAAAQVVNVNLTPQMKKLTAPNAKELMIEDSALKNFDCSELTKFRGSGSTLSKMKKKMITVNDNLVVYPCQVEGCNPALIAFNPSTKNYTLDQFSGEAEIILAKLNQENARYVDALRNVIRLGA